MSTVKKRLFGYTKEVESDPNRNLILDAFNKIHREKKYSGTIGYLGRKQYKQFLGYLILNDQRDRINQSFPDNLEEIEKYIYDAFIYGHSFINRINHLCLYPLLELIPAAYKIIDPYWEIDREGKFDKEIKISNEKLDKFIRSYQISKPYKIIRKKLEKIPQIHDFKEKDIINGVYSFRERIKKFGLQNCPEDLFELSLKINLHTPESLIGSVLLSLLYINSSLQCIDQVLFQSFISEKLISLDEDNIYNIINISSNGVSNIYEICTAQPVLFCGDIIHLEIPMKDSKIKDFCMIEEINMSYSQDYGNEYKIGLRGTDENFSSYSNLINGINI